MVVLGIDPGSITAGYAVIESSGRKFSYIDSGIMKYGHIKNFIDRLGLIYRSCHELVVRYNPDEIAVESLVYVKGTTSIMKLAQARGAMLAAFMEKYQEKVFEYSPNLVKSSVTGYGHLGKDGVQKSLSMIFGERIFKTNDESDALAIALCHGLCKGTDTGLNLKMTSKKRSMKDLARCKRVV